MTPDGVVQTGMLSVMTPEEQLRFLVSQLEIAESNLKAAKERSAQAEEAYRRAQKLVGAFSLVIKIHTEKLQAQTQTVSELEEMLMVRHLSPSGDTRKDLARIVEYDIHIERNS